MCYILITTLWAVQIVQNSFQVYLQTIRNKTFSTRMVENMNKDATWMFLECLKMSNL